MPSTPAPTASPRSSADPRLYVRPDPRPTDLVLALFVAVAAAAQGPTAPTIRLDRAAHTRFGAALADCRTAGGRLTALADDCFKNVVTGTYAALDDGVHAAIAYGFAEWTDHTYTRLVLRLTRRSIHRLLAEWTDEEQITLHRAARQLVAF